MVKFPQNYVWVNVSWIQIVSLCSENVGHVRSTPPCYWGHGITPGVGLLVLSRNGINKQHKCHRKVTNPPFFSSGVACHNCCDSWCETCRRRGICSQFMLPKIVKQPFKKSTFMIFISHVANNPNMNDCPKNGCAFGFGCFPLVRNFFTVAVPR